MKTTNRRYRVVGSDRNGYAIVDSRGGIEYDLIESLEEAERIKTVLNEGIGPEWDAVSAELDCRWPEAAPCVKP